MAEYSEVAAIDGAAQISTVQPNDSPSRIKSSIQHENNITGSLSSKRNSLSVAPTLQTVTEDAEITADGDGATFSGTTSIAAHKTSSEPVTSHEVLHVATLVHETAPRSRSLTRKSGLQPLRPEGSFHHQSPSRQSFKFESPQKSDVQIKLTRHVERKMIQPPKTPTKHRQQNDSPTDCVDDTPILAEVHENNESGSECGASSPGDNPSSAVRRSTRYGVGPMIRVFNDADEVILGKTYKTSASGPAVNAETPTRQNGSLQASSSRRLLQSGSVRSIHATKTSPEMVQSSSGNRFVNRFGFKTSPTSTHVSEEPSSTRLPTRKSSLPTSPAYIPFKTKATLISIHEPPLPSGKRNLGFSRPEPSSKMQIDFHRSGPSVAGLGQGTSNLTPQSSTTVTSATPSQPTGITSTSSTRKLKDRVSAMLGGHRSTSSRKSLLLEKKKKDDAKVAHEIVPQANLKISTEPEKWRRTQKEKVAVTSSVNTQRANHHRGSNGNNQLTTENDTTERKEVATSEAVKIIERNPSKTQVKVEGLPHLMNGSNQQDYSSRELLDSQDSELTPPQSSHASAKSHIGSEGQQIGQPSENEIDRAIRESKENFDLILARMPLVSDNGMRRTLENVLVPLAAAMEGVIVARQANIRLERAIADLTVLTAKMGANAGRLAMDSQP